jgi:tetratricopeptide (TPR) repeat protein
MNIIPESEKSFEKAVELKSLNPKVFYNYGLLLEKQKKKKQKKILLKAISINPTNPKLCYAISCVYTQTNNIPKAKQIAMKLKQLDPNNLNYQQMFNSSGI